MKNKRGTPYLRKLRNSDRGDSIQTAYAMAVFSKSYGMFRRGYPGVCMMVGISKQNIKKKFNMSWKEVKKFFREG